MFFLFGFSFLQATSDKTGSVGFTQTGKTIDLIGIVGDVTNGKTGYNTYYQHGRKDPFRSNEYTTAPAANTSLIYSNTSVTVGKTIQTPTTHYHTGGSSTTGGPYTPYYHNAWNATYTTCAGTSFAKIDGLEKVVKTVYDPCPVGYTVPAGNTFYGVTTSNFTVDGKGRKYTSNGQTLYLPFVGRRYFSSGALNGVDNYGQYYMAVFHTSPEARRLEISSSSFRFEVEYRSCASIVRPVREK